MKLKLVFLALFLSFALHANEITLEWLEQKPKTYARDFYIVQYLKQDISPQNAQDALGLVHKMNSTLLFEYVNRLQHDESSAVIQCMKANAKELVHSYSDCIMVGLSIKKALQLDALQLDEIIAKLEKSYPKYAKILKIINSPIVFSKLIASDVDTFYTVFFKSTNAFRINKLNYRLSKRALNKIKEDKRFSKFIQFVVGNPKMNLAQKSLFDVDDTALSSNTSFLLAINLISHHKEKEAMRYLDNAYAKASSVMAKDKIIFWKYQLSKEKKYLKKLSKSQHINIYSLYAKDFYHKKMNNIRFDIKQKNKKTSYDIENQFEWIKVIRDTKTLNTQKIEKYKNIFTSLETKPHLTYLYTKQSDYQKYYFINPYKHLMKRYSKSRQVLINALARQESQFIPSSISTAYAQGVMQIMPFLSKAIAKELKEEYSVFNMFKPSYSIRYANHHLNALEKRFKHPLFIAYAYNGGGGFTKSMLKNGLFQKGKYEPFLSMEKILYSETREYGKKVLANYIIYNKKINKKTLTVKALLEKLPLLFELELK